MTKIGFSKEILKEEKIASKINEIKTIPKSEYQTYTIMLLKMKMQRSDCSFREQLSNKLAKRKFFLGILGTVLPNNLFLESTQKSVLIFQKIEINNQFFLVIDGQRNLKALSLQQALFINVLDKPGTGNFQMKENAKVYRQRKHNNHIMLSKDFQRRVVIQSKRILMQEVDQRKEFQFKMNSQKFKSSLEKPFLLCKQY